MNKHLLTALGLSLLVSCGGGSDSSTTTLPTPQPPTTPETPQIELPDVVVDFEMPDTTTLIEQLTGQLDGLPLSEFFEQSYQVLRLRTPERIIADGLAQAQGLSEFSMNNISDAFYQQTIEVQQLILDKLMAYDRSALSATDQLSVDIYAEILKFDLEWADYRKFEYPATYGNFGWPGATELFVTSLLPMANQADAENYLSVVNQIPRRFSQIEQLLDARQADGIVEPFITLNFSQGNVAAVGNSAANATAYYSAFDTKLALLSDISAEDKVDLKTRLKAIIEQRVLPAYQSLAAKMLALTAVAPSQIGFGQFEGGSDFYDFTLRYFTSGNMSADEIHQKGIDELSRIHAQMRQLFDQLGYPQDETIAQLYNRVDTDSGTIPGDEAVAVYEDIIAKAYTELPNLFNELPQQEVVVIGGNVGGFYVRGSDDGARPGAFYANVASPLAYTTMPTLAYHEAVPGHHLQIALANEMDLPLFRRKEGFTSYIEGWGLYAERLAKDVGWYENDPYGDLGRLQFEAMRAARLVVDTGIHVKGWDYNTADQFHIANVGFPGSIARYSVWPGQATAYMIGMLKILELREKAQTELGDKYDIKDFHTQVIGNGAVPLNILERIVQQYIDDNQ